jgi:hypothetical protein
MTAVLIAASPNARYVRLIALAALIASQVFVAGSTGFFNSGGFSLFGPASLFVIFEVCALIVVGLVLATALALAWRGPIGRASAVLAAVACVPAGRILCALVLFGTRDAGVAVLMSYSLSLAIPEILAGIVAWRLHRRVYGA